MTDARVAQMAEVIIRYSLNIQPGDKLAIRGNSLAEPLIKEAYRAAVRAGAHVVTQITLPGLQKISLDESNDKQLAWVNPFSQIITEEFDALLAIQSEFNTREATGFDSEKLSKLSETNQPLQTRFFERAGAGELKWCATLFPTTAHAQDADMAVEDYEDFVFSACLPDRENPIGFWQKMEDRQNRLIEFLDSINEIRLVAPDTDLTVNVEGRKWINCAGHENFPDGEVFTGPVENKTNGHVRF
ncbi:MAG: aminopeptidase, partial [Candidatus Latescibacteria bacterium]|nr:aminopeptidase [Candidatus Latescibacterota bacterium]